MARYVALQELADVTPGVAAAGAAVPGVAAPGAAPAGGLGGLYVTDVSQLGGANVNSAQGLASALGDLNLGYGTADRQKKRTSLPRHTWHLLTLAALKHALAPV